METLTRDLDQHREASLVMHADPMCSIPTTVRPCLCDLHARAPEAVGTFRTNDATR